MTEANRRPDITGTAQEQENNEYKTVAKIALWKQNNITGKQPTHKGTFSFVNDKGVPTGIKYKIALWIK